MGHIIRKVYCGANRVISSLGPDTAANLRAIEAYDAPHTAWYAGGGTPVCAIDRDSLKMEAEGGYTFAEQLAITALADVVCRGGAPPDNPRTLLIVSTTKGNIDRINADFERSHLWALSERIGSYFGYRNKPLVVSTACVSGVAAAVIGARAIERGEYDDVYVLGVDVLSDFIVSGFNSFRSISPTLCRPYDAARDGLSLGEGCGALLLTADPVSDIVVSGGGMSDDANHISGPSRTGEGLRLAIDAALRGAGLTAADISFINAHGTGTPFNDEMESRALEAAALAATPCNSLKPYIGHTLGASGVIETILSAEQLRGNRIFGVKGYSQNGVPFALNVTAAHRTAELRHCLKTASGFGGTNAAVILSRAEAAEPKYRSDINIAAVEAGSVEIGGIGGVAGNATGGNSTAGNAASATGGNVAEGSAGKAGDIAFDEFIRAEYKALADPNLKFFKMDDLSKLGYVCSCKLMKGLALPYPPERVGVVMANRSSSLDTDARHQRIIDSDPPEGASPAVFVYTLANIAAAEIAIKHKFRGELTMFVSEEKNMEFLTGYSRKLIEEDICDAVLCGWCELFGNDYNAELKLIKKQDGTT